ncbi:class I SAM-dependent methyltransferase [Aetokthonos hydrillicola Thurmond2011]|jgi:ubiquinone/menaquinone biosynthesis C-methylase UbiE|uniref:Class I SAM-dependent methyltransferase n=1 Tax=Aetokthonos hydrillicola Thurmond2011 TaxID=2712845 RepID=A0AAP5M7Y1_9CYAN|nr:class I SAM-dependent methyltransferase [Aetokthonos hydrillicola]MBO3461245.1 class I SAM-dependent methyltransferase [Aetokthonos hydrillicola CCALA 1050]MBW4583709.1 class I SAM-dependent methyltransferase [Aetokthonos hydrillicola CCALA 1050]MDR9895595.1 class I SAM-dependent methyltransferase [Aetokthonos hydrillicola Thurmond2011]WJI96268.1 AesI [Aetokthonos hydrillicola Thurmond2011]
MVEKSVPETAPQELKNRIQRFYEFLNTRLNASIYAEYAMFMNWGYEHDENPSFSQIKLPNHYLNKCSTQLVLELIGDCDLTGATVLDVGCGRGGTIYTLNHFFNPKQLIGLDITAANIEYCRKNVIGDRIQFVRGDAENLPFANDEFNVVVNIESSHGYPNRLKFYQEVYRVLKPGGSFLYTDIFLSQELEGCINSIQEIGFVLEIDRDITNNVLLSREKDAEYQINAFTTEEDNCVDNTELAEDIEMSEYVMALPNSNLYEGMRKSEYFYRIYRFKKSEENVDSLNLQQEKNEPDVIENVKLRSQKQKEAIRRINSRNNNLHQ